MEQTHSINGYKKLGDIEAETVYLFDDGNSTRSEHQGQYDIDGFQEHGNIRYLEGSDELPQGRHLGVFSTVVLFVSRILGSGIFSMSSGMYQDCGCSPALFFTAWFIAAVLAFSGLYVYLELGSLVPRSGGTKIFLETIYKKPPMLASVMISLYSVLFGFNISNVLIFGEYFLHSLGVSASQLQIKLTGLAFLLFAAFVHSSSASLGIRIQNILGLLKIGLMGVIILVSFYVCLLPKSVNHIDSNLKWSEFFPAHTPTGIAPFTSAVIKGSFAFSGWNSVHTVSGEIKDPVRTFRLAGPLSLGVIAFTYLSINLVYLIVIPRDDMIKSGTLVGSYLFESILGPGLGKQFITFSIALCTGGNIFVVLYTVSRVSQEVFREGYLPLSEYMASNWPRNSPSRTIFLSVFLSAAVILGSPAGDIYNYIISLEAYPIQIYTALAALGIFILRHRYPEIKAPIRSSLLGTTLVLLITSGMFLAPLLEASEANPKGTRNWIPYPYLGLLCLFCCFIYWLMYFVVLPRIFKYELAEDKVYLEDGLTVKKWTKIYTS